MHLTTILTLLPALLAPLAAADGIAVQCVNGVCTTSTQTGDGGITLGSDFDGPTQTSAATPNAATASTTGSTKPSSTSSKAAAPTLGAEWLGAAGAAGMGLAAWVL